VISSTLRVFILERSGYEKIPPVAIQRLDQFSEAEVLSFDPEVTCVVRHHVYRTDHSTRPRSAVRSRRRNLHLHLLHAD